VTDQVDDAERFPCLDCGAAPSQPCRPLPGDRRAGERLCHWARTRLLWPPAEQVEQTTEPPRRPTVERVDRALVAFLRGQIDAIAQDEAAGQLAHDIHRLRTRIETAIDNRDPDVYYGPCQADAVETTEVDGVVTGRLLPGVKCGADLIGELGAELVQCPDCRSIWRTDELQDRNAKATRDAWARPAVIVDALRGRGETLTLERLMNWISRDKAEADAGRHRRVPYPPILPVGVEEQFDGDGRPVMTPLLNDAGEPKHDEAGRPILVQATKPVYRLGDVLDRIEALGAIEEARRSASQATAR
jgi:hypothetical protein